MKVELKPIIDQLTEAIGLPVGMTVAALIDNDELLGWIIARKMPDGQIIPVSKSKNPQGTSAAIITHSFSG